MVVAGRANGGILNWAVDGGRWGVDKERNSR